MSIPSFSLIITAAGSSTRFDSNNKKELMSLNGHSVLFNATAPFFDIPSLKAVAVTYNPAFEIQTKYALERLVLQKDVPILLVEGGDSRQQSVLNALRALKENDLLNEYVMIHDGARPFVKTQNILNTFALATFTGASAPAINIADALIEVDEDGLLVSHKSKKNLRLIQTPQIFKAEAILGAHEKAINDGKEYLDDCSIYQTYVGPVVLAQGDTTNKKITYPEDLEVK